MNWIKCSDRIPEPRVSVLGRVRFSYTVYLIQVYYNDFHWSNWFGDTINEVTHWMPLPNEPKEDENE